MINETDIVVIDGCEFIHGFNDQFEYYSHTDEHGWDWEIWKHRKGPINTKTWFASVSGPGRNGGVKMLNTAVVEGDKVIQADPLYHLNPYSSQTLLEGLAPLIKAGKWPETIRYEFYLLVESIYGRQYRIAKRHYESDLIQLPIYTASGKLLSELPENHPNRIGGVTLYRNNVAKVIGEYSCQKN